MKHLTKIGILLIGILILLQNCEKDFNPTKNEEHNKNIHKIDIYSYPDLINYLGNVKTSFVLDKPLNNIQKSNETNSIFYDTQMIIDSIGEENFTLQLITDVDYSNLYFDTMVVKQDSTQSLNYLAYFSRYKPDIQWLIDNNFNLSLDNYSGVIETLDIDGDIVSQLYFENGQEIDDSNKSNNNTNYNTKGCWVDVTRNRTCGFNSGPHDSTCYTFTYTSICSGSGIVGMSPSEGPILGGGEGGGGGGFSDEQQELVDYNMLYNNTIVERDTTFKGSKLECIYKKLKTSNSPFFNKLIGLFEGEDKMLKFAIGDTPNNMPAITRGSGDQQFTITFSDEVENYSNLEKMVIVTHEIMHAYFLSSMEEIGYVYFDENDIARYTNEVQALNGTFPANTALNSLPFAERMAVFINDFLINNPNSIQWQHELFNANIFDAGIYRERLKDIIENTHSFDEDESPVIAQTLNNLSQNWENITYINFSWLGLESTQDFAQNFPNNSSELEQHNLIIDFMRDNGNKNCN